MASTTPGSLAEVDIKVYALVTIFDILQTITFLIAPPKWPVANDGTPNDETLANYKFMTAKRRVETVKCSAHSVQLIA